MKLYKALGLDINIKAVISVVGGGGKTTTIKTLARELGNEGKSVLIATSTAIFIPERKDYEDLFIETVPQDFTPKAGSITYYAEITEGIKLKTKNLSLIDEIIERNIFDIVLIEADGSKGRPIKAPDIHEPVISNYTTLTIGVIGLDSLGRIIDEENVHRPELIRAIIGSYKKTIDNDLIVDLVLSNNGLFKNSQGRKILILNKADNDYRIKNALLIKEALMMKGIDTIICNIRSNEYY